MRPISLKIPRFIKYYKYTKTIQNSSSQILVKQIFLKLYRIKCLINFIIIKNKSIYA